MTDDEEYEKWKRKQTQEQSFIRRFEAERTKSDFITFFTQILQVSILTAVVLAIAKIVNKL